MNINLKWYHNVEEHLKALEPELSKYSFESICIVKSIVNIRRCIDLDANLDIFFNLMKEKYQFVAKDLNTRWLISICDTYADYGNEQEALCAMLIVVLCNTVKMSDSLFLCVNDNRIDNNKVYDLSEPVCLWDGMTSYLLKRGDMPLNMINRINKLVIHNAMFFCIWNEVLSRMKNSGNLLDKLSNMNVNHKFL